MITNQPPIAYTETRSFGPLEWSWITSVARDRKRRAHVVDRNWKLTINVPNIGMLRDIGSLSLFTLHLGTRNTDPLVVKGAQAFADAAHAANVAAVWTTRTGFGSDATLWWSEPNGRMHASRDAHVESAALQAVSAVRQIAADLIQTLTVDRF